MRNKFDKNNKHIHSSKGVIPSFKKESKYSVLNYLNMIPAGTISNKSSPKLKYKIMTVDPDNPNLYSIKKIGSKECVTIDRLGDQFMELCNPTRNKDQQFEIEYTGRKAREMKLLHKESKQNFIPKAVSDAYDKEQKELHELGQDEYESKSKSKINQNDMPLFYLNK